LVEYANHTGQPRLFPNPTSGNVGLHTSSLQNIVFPIIVIDGFGKQVALWNDEIEISAASLSPGCYYVVMNSKDGVCTEKLIVVSK
jgi:hypothetical protein